MKWALFIYDKYSKCGPGFAVRQLSEQEYNIEVNAIITLRNEYKYTDVAASALFDTREQAYAEAKTILERKLFESCF